MKINNDIVLDIAAANSRRAKKWKNSRLAWSELLDRLGSVTRTSETMAEYRAMTKDQQSEVKDVGGFVGGYVNNGNRSDVRHRSVLCLDADFADADLFDDFRVLYGVAACVYSTHKHTAEKPRLRLVIPLSRPVSVDEYQAIGRRIAADIGIEKFDDTTYQPQRVMFWPSCSSDADFVFDFHDAPVLDADAVLATYVDWRDISSWPVSRRVAELVKKAETKPQNPTEKTGIVGAFCRAYTIKEAIAAFVPAYVPTADPNRYTYAEGSTACGVVIYDDLYSYSHHATDPASGVLCNAFDLVRLHTFGGLDENCQSDTPPSGRPSYKAMQGLAAEDERVKAQIVSDRLAEASADFGAEPIEAKETTEAKDWKTLLKITDRGSIAATIENLVIILDNDPSLAGIVALNEMTHDIVLTRSAPWAHSGSSQWTDADDAGLRYYLEKVYGISSKDKIFDAVNISATAHAFHPVRNYLNGLTWDGVARVETLLVDYLGAEDSAYTRAVTRKTLAAAVSRVLRPGCKFDYMLTIKGRQGLGKSALVAKLGGAWFSDSFMAPQGKESYEQVIGVWLMECGELAGLRKAEVESIKQYISKSVDRFRPAYGRRTQEYPRQCIFIGTTNETQFLRDETGNRRFWVVDTPNEPERSVFDLNDEVIGQIWAEAVQIVKRGEALFLPKEIEEEARRIQEAFTEENPKKGLVEAYLDTPVPQNWDFLDLTARRQYLEDVRNHTIDPMQSTDPLTAPYIREHVSAAEIYVEALGGSAERIDRLATREVNGIMYSLKGWRSQGARLITTLYGRQRYYVRRVTA